MNKTQQQHTPGPWTLMGHGNQYATVFGAERAVAVVRDLSHFKPGETEANARLIAAAPDLLIALSNLVDCMELDIAAMGDHRLDCPNNDTPKIRPGECAYCDAKAAIAKAKGEN